MGGLRLNSTAHHAVALLALAKRASQPHLESQVHTRRIQRAWAAGCPVLTVVAEGHMESEYNQLEDELIELEENDRDDERQDAIRERLSEIQADGVMEDLKHESGGDSDDYLVPDSDKG